MRHAVTHSDKEQEYLHHNTEDEYFRRLDGELIEQARRHAHLEDEERRMSEASHITDHTVLGMLEKLGYDHTSIELFPLVPLVQVAWVDGSISAAERDRISAIARIRGVQASSPAGRQLASWLDQRPSEEFFRGTLLAMQAFLATLPEQHRNAARETLLHSCKDVAFASCGLRGWKDRICAAKRKLIQEMRTLLDALPQPGA